MGSEMCIRDRGLGAAFFSSLLPLVIIKHIQNDQHHGCNQKKDLDCLLYTSDAADERSSVDLGGRRIIKKKIHKIAIRHSRPNKK